MKIIDLLKSPKVCVSCELFPPKKGSELEHAQEIVRTIAIQGVDYMSVTYGAGGTAVGKSVALVSEIERCGVPALAHLTCVGADEGKIEGVLDQLKDAHVENVLALRGDLPQGQDHPLGDYAHASDLVKKIKSYGDFCVGGATYPEGHPEAAGLDEDLEHTKMKVEAGCDFLVTQMFFDNSMFYNFMYRLLAKGIQVPVVAGIMPVTNLKQIEKIFTLSGTPVPAPLRAMAERFADHPAALKQAGMAYAIGQIVDLIANGFTNIHIYTMNKPEIIGGIRSNLSEIIRC
ncbi:methylenetetrahydrofolate reductase [Acidaminococcus fermentans]|uniref:Methylenetetrahydrofolate reductase n=2 Tax=Acidaminococcus fermentans TaxID=905 RepID=D2RMA4_ACIFV|nr:methylenetetrahydrofolate reductase [Acidaminococcus fermentans]ADB48206.1 Methylenetetrahydrofolate reductase (NAD(P)H) [Acidaminococcus fermentans DSM 20731]MCF0139836.1 methylenetetrahydrofolate reductase [Acidaminococcus fermentans]MCI6286511.1 methylenetetrahydrofolate reductase [Acidaminococcus fermentans]MCI7194849.1 methylenetetrahydrofolate reductase [Acidaminococcus fermentans]MDD6287403.1 methylenetetrahydrofolate reductase [Acidaminococcus fermentans]